ncbi:hypothetical protein BKA70DRAFT_1241007 [Coprinopsis sp. MPI-PUGE-AT-0042]|nr:hypothetical protein BKA70DRAFT_1241007 [Coprinopsis sp. MPI-PUGE-AT-0042]
MDWLSSLVLTSPRESNTTGEKPPTSIDSGNRESHEMRRLMPPSGIHTRHIAIGPSSPVASHWERHTTGENLPTSLAYPDWFQVAKFIGNFGLGKPYKGENPRASNVIGDHGLNEILNIRSHGICQISNRVEFVEIEGTLLQSKRFSRGIGADSDMVQFGLLDVPDELLHSILRMSSRKSVRLVMGLNSRIHRVAVAIQSFVFKASSQWGRTLFDAMLMEVLFSGTNIVQLTLRTDPDQSSSFIKILDTKLPGFFRDQRLCSKLTADIWSPGSNSGLRNIWCLPRLRSLCVGREYRFVRLLAHRTVEELELEHVGANKMLTLLAPALESLCIRQPRSPRPREWVDAFVESPSLFRALREASFSWSGDFDSRPSDFKNEVEMWMSRITNAWPAIRSLRRQLTRLRIGPITSEVPEDYESDLTRQSFSIDMDVELE